MVKHGQGPHDVIIYRFEMHTQVVCKTYIHTHIHTYRDGKWTSMDKDPHGVGFREFELLSKRHSFAQSRKPYNISNMPGEVDIIFMYKHIHTCMHTYIHAHSISTENTLVYIYIHTYIHTYKHILYSSLHIHACIQTFIHTYTWH
jgi:hypothetical protein